MTGPLLVLADNYREACIWAAAHGYAGQEDRHLRGLSWRYVDDWSRLRGQHGGTFVDLRRESIEPQGAIAYLDAHDFIEAQP